MKKVLFVSIISTILILGGCSTQENQKPQGVENASLINEPSVKPSIQVVWIWGIKSDSWLAVQAPALKSNGNSWDINTQPSIENGQIIVYKSGKKELLTSDGTTIKDPSNPCDGIQDKKHNFVSYEILPGGTNRSPIFSRTIGDCSWEYGSMRKWLEVLAYDALGWTTLYSISRYMKEKHNADAYRWNDSFDKSHLFESSGKLFVRIYSQNLSDCWSKEFPLPQGQDYWCVDVKKIESDFLADVVDSKELGKFMEFSIPLEALANERYVFSENAVTKKPLPVK